MVNNFSARNSLSEVEHGPPRGRAYLYEEPPGSIEKDLSKIGNDRIFVLQYWPSDVADSYTPSYHDVTIPGGSHPLYQYVGGTARTISFNAMFTAEVKPQLGQTVDAGDLSARYTVDIVGAVARLQQYLYPLYRSGGQLGVVEAPPRLVLVMPNMNLGRDSDEVLVLLTQATPTYTHFFPDGTPRAVEMNLEFAESVQSHQQGLKNRVRFVSRTRYSAAAKRYKLALPNTAGPNTPGGH